MKVRWSRGFLRSEHVELESYSKLLGANIDEKILEDQNHCHWLLIKIK